MSEPDEPDLTQTTKPKKAFVKGLDAYRPVDGLRGAMPPGALDAAQALSLIHISSRCSQPSSANSAIAGCSTSSSSLYRSGIIPRYPNRQHRGR